MTKILLIFLIALIPIFTSAASFDCNKASSKSEKLICSDQELSQLDSELGKLYAQAKASATDADAFKSENIKRWKEREANCSDKQCLLNWYAARKVELSKWVNQSNSQTQIAKATSPSSNTQPLMPNNNFMCEKEYVLGTLNGAVYVMEPAEGPKWSPFTKNSRIKIQTIDKNTFLITEGVNSGGSPESFKYTGTVARLNGPVNLNLVNQIMLVRKSMQKNGEIIQYFYIPQSFTNSNIFAYYYVTEGQTNAGRITFDIKGTCRPE